MVKLEDKILDMLCTQQADDTVEMMRDTSYHTILQQFFRDMVTDMMQALPANFTEEEKTQLAAKINPDALCAKIFADEAKFRESAILSARQQFIRSRSDVEKILNLKDKIAQMKKESGEAAAQLEALVEKLVAGLDSMCKFNATIIADLAKIAKKDGIEKAVSRESVSAVFRKHLLTKEAYMSHYGAQARQLSDSLTGFFEGLQKAVASIEAEEKAQGGADRDTEDAAWELEMYKKMIGSIFKGFGDKLQKDFLLRKGNRIYE